MPIKLPSFQVSRSSEVLSDTNSTAHRQFSVAGKTRKSSGPRLRFYSPLAGSEEIEPFSTRSDMNLKLG